MWASTVKHEIEQSPEVQASHHALHCLRAFKRPVFSLDRIYLLPLPSQVSQMISCVTT